MTNKRSSSKLPALPQLLQRKLYKTGQTRGADDDEIYQNRVLRASTVLIPYNYIEQCYTTVGELPTYKNGYIVLISPEDYFTAMDIKSDFKKRGLELGQNTLIFYETREQWNTYNPDSKGLRAADKRTAPLGGKYVARIPGTTSSSKSNRIARGYSTTRSKGAGIRVYEYADSDTIEQCKLQLEGLFWHCIDSTEVVLQNGMNADDAKKRKEGIITKCNENQLLDLSRLNKLRIIDENNRTICPLCLEELSSQGFFDKMAQAKGRLVLDLTITQLNLFHIDELRIDSLNHRPYNLGWGHHHCNVVVKDSGIIATIEWMKKVIARQPK